jgi:hypothetical protein
MVVLSRWSFPSRPVLLCFVHPVISFLYYLDCPLWLSRPGSTVSVFLSPAPLPHCPDLADKYRLSCPVGPVPTVLSRASWPSCPVLALLYRLSCSCVMSLLSWAVLICKLVYQKLISRMDKKCMKPYIQYVLNFLLAFLVKSKTKIFAKIRMKKNDRLNCGYQYIVICFNKSSVLFHIVTKIQFGSNVKVLIRVVLTRYSSMCTTVNTYVS